MVEGVGKLETVGCHEVDVVQLRAQLLLDNVVEPLSTEILGGPSFLARCINMSHNS